MENDLIGLAPIYPVSPIRIITKSFHITWFY